MSEKEKIIKEIKEELKGAEYEGRGQNRVVILIQGLLDLYTKQEEKLDTIKEYIKQCDWHDNDVYIGEDILDIIEGNMDE